MAKWLRFEVDVTHHNRKTETIRVVSEVGRDLLGEIKWRGAWRKFCFFPEAGTLFDGACLMELAEQVEVMTRAHRATRGAQADGA